MSERLPGQAGKHDYDALMSDNHRTLRVKNGGHLSELDEELCHN